MLSLKDSFFACASRRMAAAVNWAVIAPMRNEVSAEFGLSAATSA
jgi:hypothetical protein